jgi:hypothetical protein
MTVSDGGGSDLSENAKRRLSTTHRAKMRSQSLSRGHGGPELRGTLGWNRTLGQRPFDMKKHISPLFAPVRTAPVSTGGGSRSLVQGC